MKIIQNEFFKYKNLTERFDCIHRVFFVQVPVIVILLYKYLNGFTFLDACLHRKKSLSSVSNSSLPRLACLLDDAKITREHTLCDFLNNFFYSKFICFHYEFFKISFIQVLKIEIFNVDQILCTLYTYKGKLQKSDFQNVDI